MGIETGITEGENIVRTCHAHPTHSEIFREAAMAVDRNSIRG